MLATRHLSHPSTAFLAAADVHLLRQQGQLMRVQRSLMDARIDGDLIPTLDRDGNGVDRIEYVIGMLTHLGVLSWSDVQPFLDQFDRMDVDGSGRLDRADLERHAYTDKAPSPGSSSHSRTTGSSSHWPPRV